MSLELHVEPVDHAADRDEAAQRAVEGHLEDVAAGALVGPAAGVAGDPRVLAAAGRDDVEVGAVVGVLGLAAVRYPVTRVVGEVIPWTYAAAVVSVGSGVPMFATRASHTSWSQTSCTNSTATPAPAGGAAGGADFQHCVHVDADHVTARRQPHLALAGEQRVPGFMLLAADQGLLAVGAELSVSSGFASGTGQVVVSAGSAVFGPSARLEVPAAEGPQPFFAAFSRTCRRVNSWKNRSPTG